MKGQDQIQTTEVVLDICSPRTLEANELATRLAVANQENLFKNMNMSLGEKM